MEKIEIICTVIGAISVILGGVWFIIDRVTKSGIKEYRLSQEENTIGKLPCKDHAESMKKNEMYSDAHQQRITIMEDILKNIPCKEHESDLSKHTELLESNNDMLTELSKWAMSIDESMIEKIMKKCSPYQMTNAGKYLFETSGAKEALKTMSPSLIEEIKKNNPRTGYDVEDKALSVLLNNMSRIEFDAVKEYVFRSPSIIKVENTGEEIKFNMLSIVKLMSIELRDMYLETHKEII